MSQKFNHASDQQLLLHADGELSSRESARLQVHLEECSQCRARFEEMAGTIRDAAQVQRDNFSPSEDLSGPRALLKARLAQLTLESERTGWRHLRFARGLAYASLLALLIAVGVHLSQRQAATQRIASVQPLPDPGITPGSTRQASLPELCSADSDEVVRSVPSRLQQQVFQEYGLTGMSAADFEVDYLITPGLGGSDDVRNLWPEPHSNTTWNSYVKDQLEDKLHRMVCDRKVSLDDAQKDIAKDWIAAYKKYFHTEQPLTDSMPPSLSKI